MNGATVASAAALALAVPAAAPAAKPPRPPANTLTISATPNPVTYGFPVAVSGNLTGPDNVGERVTLRQNTWPFPGYSNVTNLMTGAAGAYSFGNLRPGINTRYRTKAGRVDSPEILVTVRPRVGLSVSDSTPARGQRVRFSGSVTPAHNGRLLLIQRLGSDGVYRTVLRPILLASTATSSRYSISRRIFSDGRYRAKLSAHADHATGYSSSRFLNVP
jgi:hypothetical protein